MGRRALPWLLTIFLLGGGLVASSIARARGHTLLGQAVGGLVLVAAFFLFTSLHRLYLEAGIVVVGTLAIQPNELLVQRENQLPQRFSLWQNAPRLVIHYEGYCGERLGRTTFSGVENFISLNDGPLLRFWVPDETVTLDLQTILRSWYLRKLPVKEYCQDSRTFLLTRDLSYEQIQIYKREFGVTLY